MGCPCELRLYASSGQNSKTIAKKLIAEIKRLENKYSRYLDSSVVSQINLSAGNSEGIMVDEETAGLLDYAATCFQQSDGLFDITGGILRKAWDFKNFEKTQILPTQETLDFLLEKVGWHKLQWSRPHLYLPFKDMEIDLGGLVKEYAGDCVANLALTQGLEHGLIDLGGDIRIIGPQPEGGPWEIGIRNPLNPDTAIADIELFHGALATSGDYERFIEIDGQRYNHILNPRSGWPVAGLSSVSVVADQCLIAGTASTIAILKGKDGAQWLDGLGLPNIRVDDKGNISGTIAGPDIS